MLKYNIQYRSILEYINVDLSYEISVKIDHLLQMESVPSLRISLCAEYKDSLVVSRLFFFSF
jgi:hypothetical protein